MAKFKAGILILAASVGIVLSVLAVRHIANRSHPPALIPIPRDLIQLRGVFRLSSSTVVVVDSPDQSAAEALAQQLRAATGFNFLIKQRAQANAADDSILLTQQDAQNGLGPEGYQLEVTPHNVTIRAPASAGLFYGVQTLRELFPPQIFSPRAEPGVDWAIPCLRIVDGPRFVWRGAMLDVSRHFFDCSEIKQFLDAMALHKLNLFHWHLTDDQGWRIEIKKYPRLAEVGAWRKRIGFNLDPKSSHAYADGRYGGFYTQAEIREVVAYAQARHITIVPEIEMPGHSSAALAAYPQFSCFGGPYTTDMAEAVSAGVYCAGKEETFQFLEGVLSEVMALFPGPFIHIGGDEVPRHNWHNCPLCQARMKNEGLKNEHELESYFIGRIEKSVNEKGKRLVGWSEIRNDSLSPRTVIMDWIGGGTEAARSGHDVVMSPEEFCYLDFYQSKDRSREPPATGAYLPLNKAYAFEPIPIGLPSEAAVHILGAQGNLWTEYIPSLSELEYMAFPRLSALAEVFWSPGTQRNWTDFTRRLVVHERRLNELGINYRRGDLKLQDPL